MALAKGAACPAPADRAKRETAVAASDGQFQHAKPLHFPPGPSYPRENTRRPPALLPWRGAAAPSSHGTGNGGRGGRACLRPPQDSGEEGWAPRCAAGDGGPGGAGPTPAWSQTIPPQYESCQPEIPVGFDEVNRGRGGTARQQTSCVRRRHLFFPPPVATYGVSCRFGDDPVWMVG
jgi:hypothetical protein